MTTPEHTLVGIHAALMLGLHQRFGWRPIVIAGLCSNLPDWDGLPMLLDMQRFESGHRVWGHNFVSILLLAFVFAVIQFKTDFVGRIANRFVSKDKSKELPVDATAQPSAESSEPVNPTAIMPFLWLFGISVAVQAIHLPCDMVVSGGNGLSDWPIRPWWPLSNQEWVFPLIPWGDVGPTVIMMAGVIAVAKFHGNKSVQSTSMFLSTTFLSALTLLTLVVYLVVRGLLF